MNVLTSPTQQPQQPQQTPSIQQPQQAPSSPIKVYRLSRRSAMADRASNGWLLKWKQNNTWIKTPGFIIEWTGESYAEILASEVCKDFNIKNALEYRPCIAITEDEDPNLPKVAILSCESTNFTRGDELFISMQKYLSMVDPSIINEIDQGSVASGQEPQVPADGGYGLQGTKAAYEHYLERLKDLTGLNLRTHTEDMIFLDFLICNYDRNLWNLGIITDPNGGYREAPIFDNGNSLGLCRFEEGEFYRESLHTDGQIAHPFCYRFDQQLDLIRSGKVYTPQGPQGRGALGGLGPGAPGSLGTLGSLGLYHTQKTLDFFKENCSTESNRLGVVNPIPLGSIVYIESMIAKNLAYYNERYVR